jgi:hypothetical protein
MTTYEALKALVEKLDAIEKDPQYKGIWTLHWAHGGDYTGPTYTKEIADAKKVLENLDEPRMD